MNYTLQTEIEYVRENYYINESDAQSKDNLKMKFKVSSQFMMIF